MAGGKTWYSGRGSCADYRIKKLCTVCERELPGRGEGWFLGNLLAERKGSAGWGSPADAQYANGGMTAVDACCEHDSSRLQRRDLACYPTASHSHV